MKKLAYNKTTGELTKQIANTFMDSGLSLTTTESCTGGLLAAALCAEADTAVSEQTVIEMSDGARVRAGTDISIAISGYAGPDGGEDGTPAGTIWFAWNFRGQIVTKRTIFSGGCQDVIEKSVCYSLEVLVEEVSTWQRH